MSQFDIFLSHNSQDKPAVREIKQLLAEWGVSGWLDEDELPPGQNWIPLLEQAMSNCKSAGAFVGANGIGPWEDEEIQVLLNQAVRKKVPVIPVLLPGDYEEPELPLFLSNRTFVDMRQGITTKLIERLIWGITRQKPQPKATKTNDQTIVKVDRLPTVAGDFLGREAELQLLDEALEGQGIKANNRIIQFIASGGTGKTKLLRHWLNKRRDQIGNYIVWSFYSQGTSDSKQVSATPLFIEALNEFAVDYEQFKTDEDRADALADLLIEHQCLLVLDGLEPLQHGGTGFDGQLKDRAMKRLLQKLAQWHSSLCIITTRINVHELKDRAHVISHPLDNLSTGDGVKLLRSWGVQGTDKEIHQAVDEVEGHALTLHLLGNALTTYLDSDIRKRDTLDVLVDDYAEQGRHAFKVMQGYQHWLRDENGEPTAELQLLYLLGLFDYPIEIAVLQVLWDQQIEGLTAGVPVKAWKIALRALQEKHRLLSLHGERPDLLDCHPLIREYFGRQLKQHQSKAWQQAHEALYHYYKALPEKKLPDTVEEMQPLFHAVAHGCAAGLHGQVLDGVYWPRIRRKKEAFIVIRLGAYSDDLAALASFYSQPWREVAVSLSNDSPANLLSWTGFSLRAVGRLREALEPFQKCLKTSLKQKDWKTAAEDANNLSELQLALGYVTDAVISGKESVKYADLSGDLSSQMAFRTTLAEALKQAGLIDQALDLCDVAEQIQKVIGPRFPKLYSLWGVRYCDLLLIKRRQVEVLKRARQTLEWGKVGYTLLDNALDKLILGRAYHAQKEMMLASEWLKQALDGLYEARSQDLLPLGLLSRSSLRCDLGEYRLAKQDLAEVFEIAEAGEMRLFLVDYHLEMARLLLASNEKCNIQTHITKAKDLINETGYHRRDGDLAELEAKL